MPNPIAGIANMVGGVVGQIGNLIDGISTTDEERLKAKAELATIAANLEIEMAKVDAVFAQERSKVLVAEAQSESWLTRNWRPIAALTFVYIIFHTYVLVPIFGIPPVDVPSNIWDVIQMCLGGYVIGRTVENSLSYAVDVAKEWKTNRTVVSNMPLADVGNANK